MRPTDQAASAFQEAFGRAPDGLWWAPGRVNLIGEHTDYNDGFVLPLALQLGVVAAVGARPDTALRMTSLQGDGVVTADVAKLAPGAVSGWAAYVAGVVWAMTETGHGVPGLDIAVDGDVPSGAGLSSSAALECVVAVACRDLVGSVVDPTTLAGYARRAENDFVGAPTGVMDQMASVHGLAGHLLFLDTRTLEVENVPFDLRRHGLALLVVDSKAPHALVDSEYAERRRACEDGARRLGVPALRDVSVDELDTALARIDDDVIGRRVRHVVTEDARVLDVVARLRAGSDPRGIGPFLTQSHASMRDDFEITVPQVDTAVEAALSAGAHGARMTGGGFGGCVIALVEADAVDEVVSAVERAYSDEGFDAPAAFVAEPSDGARRLA